MQIIHDCEANTAWCLRGGLEQHITLAAKDQSTTIQQPAIIDRNAFSSSLYGIFMVINRSSMFLLLQAKGRLVYSLHYSVALHFYDDIS